jgi:hypothetical protein
MFLSEPGSELRRGGNPLVHPVERYQYGSQPGIRIDDHAPSQKCRN